MAGNTLRYELHFHSLAQDTAISDFNNVTSIFQDSLTRSTCAHQLPPAPADFTGRQDECSRVTLLLIQATHGGQTVPPIAAVTGIAGVGKSALALQVAYQLKSDFPDAQLYVNLRGSEGQPLEPVDVLASFLRAWGVDEQSLPDNLTERVALYRSLLEGKRALVVLDNAHDEVQVRPLVPSSSTCAVLITSRKRLAALEGVTLLDLAPMPQLSALELLHKLVEIERIQAQPEAAKQIVELCTQLPLAIRITSGMLQNKLNWQLSDCADQLNLEQQRLAQLRLSDLQVRASLSLSYQQLDVEAARLFRLLGLLTGSSFATSIAAVLLETEPELAKKSMKCLIDRRLLEPVSEGRYRFHDLVRLFARGQLAQEEPAEARQAARLRASRWYLNTAQKINLALNPENRRQFAQVLTKGKNQSPSASEHNVLLLALNWFEMERTNLVASVEWAHQSEARELVIQLASNLVNFFNSYAYWGDWERTHLLALEATRELGNRLAEAQTLINLGNVHSLRSNWEKASSCYEQSLGICGELGERLGVAKALGNLGNVYSRQGEWGKASECYKQSLSMFTEIQDRYGEAQTLANMGIVAAQQGDKENAVALWQAALTKLPFDLPKSQRLAQWIHSIQGSTGEIVQNTQQRSAPPQLLYIIGGFILVVAIAFFVLLRMG